MTNIFVGQHAIDFTAMAVMPDNEIIEFNLKHHIKQSKCILFFYPLDFTFVCPSEIIAFHNRIGEFANRNTKIVSVSVDSHYSHLAWKKTNHEKGGIGNIQFPMISDLTKQISANYNVLLPQGMALRGTFIIDENFVLRHITINDLPLGRNVDEMLRLVDAIDFHKAHGEVCPAGWQKGQEGMNASAHGVANYLSSNYDKL